MQEKQGKPRNFRQFIGESILLEMPHIQLDNGKTVDLELEFHSKSAPKEFLAYMDDWLDGKPISTKNPGFKMQVNKASVADFSKQLLQMEFVRLFVIKHYGEQVWKALEKQLKSKAEK